MYTKKYMYKKRRVESLGSNSFKQLGEYYFGYWLLLLLAIGVKGCFNIRSHMTRLHDGKIIWIAIYTMFTQSKNDLDCNLDCDLDR